MSPTRATFPFLAALITICYGSYDAPASNGESPLSTTTTSKVLGDEYIVVAKGAKCLDGLTQDVNSASTNDCSWSPEYQRLNSLLTNTNTSNTSINATILRGLDFASMLHVRLDSSALSVLLNHPDVKFIEQVQKLDRSPPQFSRAVDPQTVPNYSWALDRINQRDLPLDGNMEMENTGNGVDVWVLDSGIDLTNPDFAGRVVDAFSAFGGSANDDNGHGTAVAGVIGGTRYGVAKKVILNSVKVIDATGGATTSTLIAGIEAVARLSKPGKRGVVNMSLDGGVSQTVDEAVNWLINMGLVVVAAAGNSADNACDHSPGRVPRVITVGSTNKTDGPTWFTAHGPCVTIVAPGTDIHSVGYKGEASIYATGTSLSSPLVAGAAAVFIASQSTWPSPERVMSKILNAASRGVVVGAAAVGLPDVIVYPGPGAFSNGQDGRETSATSTGTPLSSLPTPTGTASGDSTQTQAIATITSTCGSVTCFTSNGFVGSPRGNVNINIPYGYRKLLVAYYTGPTNTIMTLAQNLPKLKPGTNRFKTQYMTLQVVYGKGDMQAVVLSGCYVTGAYQLAVVAVEPSTQGMPFQLSYTGVEGSVDC